MPEGDTIFRTAQVLRRVLVGKPIVAARSAYGPGYGPPPDLSRVVGSTVTGVESRGKHLLIDFSVGLTLHTHLGMSGAWHTYPVDAAPARIGAAAARVETERHVAACLRPTVVELLETSLVGRVPSLASLGPDLLGPDFDPSEARRRLRARRDVPVAQALLDQRALAGLGNVYKSEVLFLVGIHPGRRVADLDDAQLDVVIDRARELLWRNVGGGGRVTTGSDAARAGAPLWVYGRAGRPCRRCGTPIRVQRDPAGSDGSVPRTTYWCSRCQAGPPAE